MLLTGHLCLLAVYYSTYTEDLSIHKLHTYIGFGFIYMFYQCQNCKNLYRKQEQLEYHQESGDCSDKNTDI